MTDEGDTHDTRILLQKRPILWDSGSASRPQSFDSLGSVHRFNKFKTKSSDASLCCILFTQLLSWPDCTSGNILRWHLLQVSFQINGANTAYRGGCCCSSLVSWSPTIRHTEHGGVAPLHVLKTLQLLEFRKDISLLYIYSVQNHHRIYYLKA